MNARKQSSILLQQIRSALNALEPQLTALDAILDAQQNDGTPTSDGSFDQASWSAASHVSMRLWQLRGSVRDAIDATEATEVGRRRKPT